MKDKIAQTEYEEKSYVNHVKGNGISRELATINSFHVGSLLFITVMKEWGVGIILEVDNTTECCYIHWQGLNTEKWHNMHTLLHYLQKDMIKTNNIEKTSFIIKKG